MKSEVEIYLENPEAWLKDEIINFERKKYDEQLRHAETMQDIHVEYELKLRRVNEWAEKHGTPTVQELKDRLNLATL